MKEFVTKDTPKPTKAHRHQPKIPAEAPKEEVPKEKKRKLSKKERIE